MSRAPVGLGAQKPKTPTTLSGARTVTARGLQPAPHGATQAGAAEPQGAPEVRASPETRPGELFQARTLWQKQEVKPG